MTEPSKELLTWAAAAVGPGARVVDVRAFRANPSSRGPWRLGIQIRGGGVFAATLKAGPAEPAAVRNRSDVTVRDALAAEAAGLRLAERHGLPAPRLLGLELDGVADSVAILYTALGGLDRTLPGPESARAFGAATAALHAIPLSPGADVPVRGRPRHGDDYIWLRMWAARYQAGTESERADIVERVVAERPGFPADDLPRRLLRTRTTPLIRAAEERIASVPPPEGPIVLVHGDLCATELPSRTRSCVVGRTPAAGMPATSRTGILCPR